MRIWVLGILALLTIYVERGMAVKGLSVSRDIAGLNVFMWREKEAETVFELN